MNTFKESALMLWDQAKNQTDIKIFFFLYFFLKKSIQNSRLESSAKNWY